MRYKRKLLFSFIFLFIGCSDDFEHPLNIEGEPLASAEEVEQVLDEYFRFSSLSDLAGLDDHTILHAAAGDGDLKSVKVLIRASMHVDIQDNQGWTPLHYASYEGHLETVRYLVEKGASLWSLSSLVFDKKLLPLHQAVLGENLEVVKYLVEREPDTINIPTLDGDTPLDLAYKGFDEEEIIAYLLAEGAVESKEFEDEADENSQASSVLNALPDFL